YSPLLNSSSGVSNGQSKIDSLEREEGIPFTGTLKERREAGLLPTVTEFEIAYGKTLDRGRQLPMFDLFVIVIMFHLFVTAIMFHLFFTVIMFHLFVTAIMFHLFFTAIMFHLFVTAIMFHLFVTAIMFHLIVTAFMFDLFVTVIIEQRFSGNFPINLGQSSIESFSSLGNSPHPSTCQCFQSSISLNSSFSRELKGFLEDELP
ncbi:hypothetical protein H5410_058355, partial [Solanum commersonii]